MGAWSIDLVRMNQVVMNWVQGWVEPEIYKGMLFKTQHSMVSPGPMPTSRP